MSDPTLGWYSYRAREYRDGVLSLRPCKVRVRIEGETATRYKVRTLQPMEGPYGAPTGSTFTPRKKSVQLDSDEHTGPSWLPYKD